MLSWWFIELIGCLCMSIICGQDSMLDLAYIEPDQDDTANMDVSVNDTSNALTATRMMLTTTQTLEPFSCHECMNCKSKSDFIPRVCQAGITMCYVMQMRIHNTSRITRRGCSSLKTQCAGADEDQNNSIESITCCTSHKCNDATHFRPLFFLWTSSLFTFLINISKDKSLI